MKLHNTLYEMLGDKTMHKKNRCGKLQLRSDPFLELGLVETMELIEIHSFVFFLECPQAGKYLKEKQKSFKCKWGLVWKAVSSSEG